MRGTLPVAPMPSRPARRGARRRQPASGQKSASVCIFSWLISTASTGMSRPVISSRRALQVLDRQLAHVAAVHPAQLLLVEHGRVLRHALEVNRSDQLVGREEGRALVVAPAQQRDVVAHGLRQVALLAQLLDRRRAVALRELLAVGAVEQREVRVDGRLRFEARRIISWRGVFDMWSSPRTTCVMPMSRSSTATARL